MIEERRKKVNDVKRIFQNKGIRFSSIQWILSLMRPYLWKIFGLILLRCLLSALGVGSAVVNKYIVDMASKSLGLLWGITLAVICMIVNLIGNVFLSIFITKITEKFSFHIRKSLYEQILCAEWNSRNQYHSEELLSRMTSDVQTITTGIVTVSTSLLASLVQLGMAFLVLWQMDPMLSVFALIMGPFAVVFSFIMGRKMKDVQMQLQQTEADYRVYLQEQISNADTIKVFQQEVNSMQALDKLQQERMRWVIKKNRLGVWMRLGINVVFSGSYLVAFISGAVKISAGLITYGTMTAFLSLVNQVQMPIYSMYQMLKQIISLLASSTRAMEITAMPKETVSEKEKDFGTFAEVKIENLSFSYNEEKPVIHQLSAKIPSGSTVVLSGPSGRGKTTLVRLILGFLAPAEGSIEFVDENGNYMECSSETRNLISYVQQGYTLFSGTITENLRIGNPEANRAEMQQALELACAWSFVKELPQGMDTSIGEKAYGLSGGQAQRIAIARALLRKTPILILDEATSSLDEATERQILTNIYNYRKKQTCIMISHNSSVRTFADQIIDLPEA